MALTKYSVLILAVGILPFVENAPGNILRTGIGKQRSQSKLFFFDIDTDGTLDSKFPLYISPMGQDQTIKNGLTKKQFMAKSIQDYPPLEQRVSSRLSEMDERRIWGIAEENKEIEKDESYYNRPLALPKSIVKTSKKRNIGNESKVADTMKPNPCDISTVTCCQSHAKFKECLESQECLHTQDLFVNLCSESINRVMKDSGINYR